MKPLYRILRGSLALIALTAVTPRTGHTADLTIGTVTATATPTAITLSFSAGLSGGSGNGYHISLYRGITPDFKPEPSTKIATLDDPGTVPYTDHDGLQPGIVYYYKIIGTDGSGATANAIPDGLGAVPGTDPLPITASLQEQTLNIVYIGDSITQGAGVSDAETQAAPVICSDDLRRHGGIRGVYFANEGHSGHTTTDYLPGGEDYSHAEAAARKLQSDNPGLLVFSIMLGTNDSATTGPNGAPATPSLYRDHMHTLIDRLLADFPTCRIFVHDPIWYSPNTHNFSNYEEAGLARLTTYFPMIASLVSGYSRSASGQVLVGDQQAYGYFAANYRTELVPEMGQK